MVRVRNRGFQGDQAEGSRADHSVETLDGDRYFGGLLMLWCGGVRRPLPGAGAVRDRDVHARRLWLFSACSFWRRPRRA